MKFGRALREVVRFEILYKLFILCLVNPVMREIYQTYISSVGVSFNARIVGIFLNLKGAFIFLLLFFTAAFLIFFELSVVIRIVALCRAGAPFRLRTVMKTALWSLGAAQRRGPGGAVLRAVSAGRADGLHQLACAGRHDPGVYFRRNAPHAAARADRHGAALRAPVRGLPRAAVRAGAHGAAARALRRGGEKQPRVLEADRPHGRAAGPRGSAALARGRDGDRPLLAAQPAGKQRFRREFPEIPRIPRRSARTSCTGR